MAAALHAKILSEGYTPGMTLAWRAAATIFAVDRPVAVVPLQFAAPRPQLSTECYANIFSWTEEEELAPPQRNVQEGLEYLRHGGAYSQRVLAVARSMVQITKDLAHAHTIANPLRSNDAPRWPPSSHLDSNPPDWVMKTSHLQYASVASSPEAVSKSEPIVPLGTQASSGRSEKSNLTHPSVFIGHDGNEWPMPPAECMAPVTKRSPALSFERHTVVHTSSQDHYLGVPIISRTSPPSELSSARSSLKPLTPADDEPLPGGYRHDMFRSVRLGAVGQGRPSAGLAPAPDKSVPAQKPNPFGAALFLDIVCHDVWSDVALDCSKDGFFVGRDGYLWPLPSKSSFGAESLERNPTLQW